jgi:hypothetical protein
MNNTTDLATLSPNQLAYQQSLLREFRWRIEAIDNASIDKIANYEFNEVLAVRRELFLESVQWLVDGSYGEGAYQAAQAVLSRKRMNRRAWLFVTVAAFEWGVKSAQARKIWNSLSWDAQRNINEDLDLIIAEATS